MDRKDYWRLCDELSVIQAVLLILDYNPDDFPPYIALSSSDLPQNAHALLTAIKNAIAGGRLQATYIVNEMAPPGSVAADQIDANHTRVLVDELRGWLRKRGITTGFFFPDIQPGPDYLNSEHNNYSPKLAAAIRSWEAANNDPEFKDNPQHPKQIIISWLTNNAKKFDLVDKNGNVMKKVIEEQIAKVANWRPKGGAPKTQRAKKNLKIKDI